jgi:hypothetical protein
MKDRIYKILLGLLLTLPFFACKYEPVGEYDRKANQNADPPSIQIVDLNLKTDTIIVYYEKGVKFKFDTQYHNVLGVRLLIDTTEIGKVNSGTGEIKIEKWKVAVGIHDLKLQVYTGSGTGSIADSIGLEGYLFSNSWKLIVKWWSGNEVSAFVTDGLLHIKWPEYDAGRFEEYYIYKYYDYGSTEIEIGSSKNSEFIDSTYVGEYTDYIIKGRDNDGNIVSLGSTGTVYNLPELSYSGDTLNNYSIKWTKSRFYNAVDSYLVFLGYDNEKFQLVNSTHDPEDTTFNFKNGFFTDIVNLKLRVVPKKVNAQYYPERFSTFENIMTFDLSFRFPTAGNDIYPVNDHEFVYISGFESIYRYSLSRRNIVEEFRPDNNDALLMLNASPSGNYITLRADWFNKNILFTNSSGMHPFTEINGFDIPGDVNYNHIPVSDIGTGLINVSDTDLLMYDLKNLSILGKFTRKSKYPLYATNLKLSANGDYFSVNDDSLRLIHFVNGDFKPVLTLRKPGGNMLLEFDPVNPEQIIFWNGSQLSVKRCDDFSTVYEFPLTENLEDIDYRNDEMLTWTEGYLHIRDLKDGSLNKDIPTNYVPYQGFRCYLFNQTIVHTGGIFYTIN